MIKWKKKESKTLLKTNIFKIESTECYHTEKDVVHEFNTIISNNWINVVAETIDGKIIMVRQHRLGTDEITLETPAGLIEKEEAPELAAARELKEETGYTSKKITLLKKLSANPAILNNYIYFYYAYDCIKTSPQNLDKSEDIEIAEYTKDEVITMIRNGSINHSIIVTALSLYFMSEHNSDEKKINLCYL